VSGFSGASGISGFSGAPPTNVTTTASTSAGFILFAAASTTGSQAVLVDAGLSVNGSTNAITGGIDGGTF
jgi:hypothetical protein